MPRRNSRGQFVKSGRKKRGKKRRRVTKKVKVPVSLIRELDKKAKKLHRHVKKSRR